MNKKAIFQKLVNSWLIKDKEEFLSVMTEDVVYTECHGAQYFGKTECERWFDKWTKPSINKVKYWKIHSVHEDKNTEVAFFTWTFECNHTGVNAVFDGISMVRFSGNLISEIQEFEQKHEKYRPHQES
jgi:mannosyltransferase OCH1-like enzyme